jgi:hypothetical protein
MNPAGVGFNLKFVDLFSNAREKNRFATWGYQGIRDFLGPSWG